MIGTITAFIHKKGFKKKITLNTKYQKYINEKGENILIDFKKRVFIFFDKWDLEYFTRQQDLINYLFDKKENDKICKKN